MKIENSPSHTLLDKKNTKQFLKQLLTWYKREGRHDMPWRKTKDPYRIIVSEYMLQQTTVQAVRPYYDRFIQKFPNLKSLAKSDLNDVLALWSGLGYYARARNLWSAMAHIHKKFKGKIPSDQKTLEKLPGIGPYTSGAITALAFNKPAVVLDGNIIRVLMRVLVLEETPKLKAVQAILRKFIFDLTTESAKNKAKPFSGPRHVVLALMDLGATLCSPKKPACLVCPLAQLCMAKKFNKQDDIPPRDEPLERPTVKRLFAVLQHKGRWLLGQRPHEGLFGGLWEFVGTDLSKGVEPIPYLESMVDREIGLEIRVRSANTAFEHILSHRTYVVKSFQCEFVTPKRVNHMNKKGFTYERFKWVDPAQVHRLGISTITKRIIALQATHNSISQNPDT